MRYLEPLENRTLFATYTASTAAQLIAAMNQANNSAQADTITLAAGATLSLTAAHNTTDGPNGLPVIVASGGGLTILGNGGTIERSGATDTPAFRLFNVAVGGSLTLDGLTVRGGLISSTAFYPEPAQGGGIYSRGSLNLIGVTVENNTALGGTPNFNSAGVPAGPAQGGGIYSGGTLTIAGSIIRNNVAAGGRGSDSYSMKGFFNYLAVPGADGSGGGIYVAGGGASISHTTIRSNAARGGFGGRLGGSTLAGGNGYGGGLYAAAGALTIRNSSINANVAQSGGGLIWKRNALVPGNEGKGVGGGIYINGAASTGLDAFTVRNTTGNTASSSSPDIFGRYRKII